MVAMAPTIAQGDTAGSPIFPQLPVASALGGPVAVLVDEYDQPILDALEAPEVARANRDYLRGAYAVVSLSDVKRQRALQPSKLRYDRRDLGLRRCSGRRDLRIGA